MYDKEGELVLVLTEAGVGRIATLAFSIDASNRQLPLLFIAAQICAHAWDLAGVTAVSGHQHVYSHRKYRQGHGIQRGYDQLWQELGGEPRSGWYWFSSLPQLRDLATVPSHKRAMYVRRQSMLTTLASDMHIRLADITIRPLKALPEPTLTTAKA